jgi:pilus assembly protein FimV
MDKPLQENDMAIDESSDREDIALSTSELDDVLSSADLSGEAGEAQGPSLEKYGIWIKIEPETLDSVPESEDVFELAELETESEGGKEAKLTAEEEQLLGELESEGVAEAGTLESADFDGLEKGLETLGRAAPPAEADEDLTIADLDVGMEELAGEPPEAEIEVPLSEKVAALDTFEEAAVEAQAGAASKPKSDEILGKIEQDLKQIKLEIQNLKKELAGIARVGAGAADVHVPHGPPAAPGFLAEEEDDSIALTGDELDNILNTADITEEKAGGLEAGLEEELSPLEAVEPAALEAEPVEEAELIEPGSLSIAPDQMEAPGEGPAEELPAETGFDLAAPEEPAPAEVPILDFEALTEETPAEEPAALESEELILEDLGELPEEEDEAVPESLSSEEPLVSAEELTLDEDLSEIKEPAAAARAKAAPAAELEEGNLAEELELVEDLSAAEPPESLETMPLEAEPLEAEPLGAEPLGAEPLEPEPLAAEPLGAEPLEVESLEAEPLEAVFLEPEPLAAELLEAEPLGAEPLEAEPLETGPAAAAAKPADSSLPSSLREDVRSVLSYLDQLLEALPDDKVRQFAQSEYFGVYKRLFEELGLGA